MTGSDLQAPHHHVAQPAPSVTAMVLADVHCIETHERPLLQLTVALRLHLVQLLLKLTHP
ncbi:MAG: hypothetical protein FRX49_01847 [Trebouxia sp. A1-2]|nr:MAG: hypothetical protein FRX49_01847 [Trebouxia sp. A1-2]